VRLGDRRNGNRTAVRPRSARRGANPCACPELKRLVRLAGAQCSSRLRDDTPARRILVLSARCFRRPRNGPLTRSRTTAGRAPRARRDPRAHAGPAHARPSDLAIHAAGRAECVFLCCPRSESAQSRRRTYTNIGSAPAPHRAGHDARSTPKALNDAQERPNRTSPYRSARSGSVQTWRHTRSVGTVTSESSAAQD
jgi:hypothetical protein